MLLPESAFGRQHISIHALREEGDEQRTPGTIRASGFLSTPSARRATATVRIPAAVAQISIHALREEGDKRACRTGLTGRDISIHALREEGDCKLCRAEPQLFISIHALREEGDVARETPFSPRVTFLSTPSARRATALLRCRGRHRRISIHALREEGDPAPPAPSCPRSYFYPRPPRGGRHTGLVHRLEELEFLSTPSARRATFHGCVAERGHHNFYPRPPRGGRPAGRR